MGEATIDEGCSATDVSIELDGAEADRLAEVFKALADPTRVRLVAYLAAARGGTVCACHLPGELGISQPTLSHHLKKLVNAGIITREQRGRWAHFAVEPDVLRLGQAFLGKSIRCC